MATALGKEPADASTMSGEEPARESFLGRPATGIEEVGGGQELERILRSRAPCQEPAPGRNFEAPARRLGPKQTHQYDIGVWQGMPTAGFIRYEFKGNASRAPRSPRRSVLVIYQDQGVAMALVHPRHHACEKEVRASGDKAGIDEEVFLQWEKCFQRMARDFRSLNFIGATNLMNDLAT